MEFSENYESFGHFNNDPFCNLLDEEIPQNIFDELMNDVNYQALGFDMNSVSSEDSGRSSSSYDLGPRLDTFGDQAMVEVPQITSENIKSETIEDDPMAYMCTTNSPPSQMIASPVAVAPAATVATVSPTVVSAAAAAATVAGNMQCTDRIISQPILTTQRTISQVQQKPQFILSQPQKIVVKQEPITFHTQQNVQPHQQHQQIFTLQSIGGQQFVVTNANQTPVHTIVNGAAGILTKIPVVPVTSIIQQPITATPKKTTLAPTTMPTALALKPTKVTVKPNTPPTTTTITAGATMTSKTSKKSGHNIIERRYRTSIVRICGKSASIGTSLQRLIR